MAATNLFENLKKNIEEGHDQKRSEIYRNNTKKFEQIFENCHKNAITKTVYRYRNKLISNPNSLTNSLKPESYWRRLKKKSTLDQFSNQSINQFF